MSHRVRPPSDCRMPPSHTTARGFTLIEMMATLVLMGIFAQTVGSLTGWQIKQYLKTSRQLALDDTARGTLNMMRDDAHQAGFGFAKTADRSGGVFVGACDPTNYGDTSSFTDFACTKREENGTSDRLRFLYGDPRANSYLGSATTGSWGPCTGGSETGDYLSVMISPNDVIKPDQKGPAFSNCYVVGGSCEDGSTVPASSMIMCLFQGSPVQENTKGCAYILSVYYEGRYPTSVGCSKGWKPGYSLFYLDQGGYLLRPGAAPDVWDMYRGQRNTPEAIIAKNVSQFKVTYGIDLSSPMDNKLDVCPTCTDDPTPGLFDTNLSWCRDLGTMCGMTLSDGSALTSDNIYSRIIAVHVSFILYKDTPADGSIYRATFNLKNRLTQ